MRVFGCGDVFVAKRLPEAAYEGFEEIQALMMSHDVRFGNLETTVHDNEGYPARFPGGGYAMASPRCLQDLKEFGFNTLNLANNHALDYSHKGLEATIRHLQEEDLVFFGAGLNLAEASRPRYVECQDGRVAFIGVTSSFHDSDAAGPSGGIVPGRPGVNPLRRKEYYQVTSDLYEALETIAEETGMNDGHKWSAKYGYVQADESLSLRDMKFVKGTKNKRITEPLPSDMGRIKHSIEEAAIQADCVVVSFHSHQMQGDASIPADFIVDFCHECVDAGANVVFGHGAHELRGLEVYKGVPVFYGLGDFIFQNEMVEALPKEFYMSQDIPDDLLDHVGIAMNRRSNGSTRGLGADEKAWQSVAASIDFNNGVVEAVRVYPISLGFDLGRTRRGWPVIDKCGAIIDGFVKMSQELYGTEARIEDNCAEVVL